MNRSAVRWATTLLRSVATVLEQCLRQGDTVSRLGGDEFVLLLPGFHRDDDVVKIAEKLRVSLRTPFTIGGRHVSVTGSLGIAVFPEDGADAESLLQNAAVALRRAKEKGGDAFDVHAPATSARATERLALESALRRALVGNSSDAPLSAHRRGLHREILSVEALLRFRNASGRLVPASEFLRELDATSLAVPLGLWSLRTACSQVRIWRDQGFGELSVAVNLTGRQLLHPSLVALVQRALGETGLPPDGLDAGSRRERSRQERGARSRSPLRAARSSACAWPWTISARARPSSRGSIDFPVDGIKIDRSVIRGIESDESQKGVAAAAIALARARHLDVVAEGVETEGQRGPPHPLALRPSPGQSLRRARCPHRRWSVELAETRQGLRRRGAPLPHLEGRSLQREACRRRAARRRYATGNAPPRG